MAVEDAARYVVQANEYVADAKASAAEVKVLKAACVAAGPSPVAQRQAEQALELARYVEDVDFLMRDTVALGVEATSGITWSDAHDILHGVGLLVDDDRAGWEAREDGLPAPQGVIADHLAYQRRVVTDLVYESRRDAEAALEIANSART